MSPGESNHALMRSRRSVRRFLPQLVPQEMLERILETAVSAPSAHNRQPWRFVVLTSAESRATLVDAMGADFRRDLLADGLPPGEVEAQVERSRRRIQNRKQLAETELCGRHVGLPGDRDGG